MNKWFFCDEGRNSSLRRIREYSYTRQSINCKICLHRLVEKENTRLGRLFNCIQVNVPQILKYPKYTNSFKDIWQLNDTRG